MSESCRLCGEVRPLLISHILPAFVFRWKRESSGGSPLRSSVEPNLRVQDGIKKHWLCAECEERFSKDERAFANQIFYPYLDGSAAQLHYGPWLLRFCASISWRVLRLAIERDSFGGDWTPADVQACRNAEVTWREFLQGARLHPGTYRQHLIPLDAIANGGGDLAPNINRYLTRTIAMDLCRGQSAIFTFAKLGRFAIFGTVRPDAQAWKGTAIQANEGWVGLRRSVLPAALWHYLNDKARESAAAIEGMSDKQKAKMNETFRKNIDAFAGSDAFRSMSADVEMFGDAAFMKGP